MFQKLRHDKCFVSTTEKSGFIARMAWECFSNKHKWHVGDIFLVIPSCLSLLLTNFYRFLETARRCVTFRFRSTNTFQESRINAKAMSRLLRRISSLLSSHMRSERNWYT
jgi:hypothetical protein